MDNSPYLEVLAAYYPTLAQKKTVRTTVNDGKQDVGLAAKPCHNGTFINITFEQGEKFLGFRTVSLLELEPIYR